MEVHHPDAHGTTRVLTNASGAPIVSYLVDENGKSQATTGNTSQSLLFNGEPREDVVGLTYLRSRYYDPVLGRFLTRDTYGGTLGRSASLNRYAYAFDNPASIVDPSGADPWWVPELQDPNNQYLVQRAQDARSLPNYNDPRWNYRSTGYFRNTATGEEVVTHSGPRDMPDPEAVDPRLAAQTPAIDDWYRNRPPGVCCEYKGANQLLQNDPSPDAISHIEGAVVNDRSGNPLRPCPNCRQSLAGSRIVGMSSGGGGTGGAGDEISSAELSELSRLGGGGGGMLEKE